MWDERDEWLLVCLSGASDSSRDAAAHENLTRGKLVFLSSLSSKQLSTHECLINQEWQKGTTVNKEMPISISYALFFWQFTVLSSSTTALDGCPCTAPTKTHGELRHFLTEIRRGEQQGSDKKSSLLCRVYTDTFATSFVPFCFHHSSS